LAYQTNVWHGNNSLQLRHFYLPEARMMRRDASSFVAGRTSFSLLSRPRTPKNAA